MIYKLLNSLIIILSTITLSANPASNGGGDQVITHSHNDYEQDTPLFDALSFNFRSIEADVFPIGDSLFVAHEFSEVKPGRTLRELYLNPLKNIIGRNNGSVYGDGKEVILFIDIKADGLKTYKLLHKILQNYKAFLSVVENGVKTKRSLLVVVSGERPFKYMQAQTVRYTGFDGRLDNLDSGIAPILMPVVSDNWRNYFKWDGTGEMPPAEKEKLMSLSGKAREKGYLLRFWGTPNRSEKQRHAIWHELIKAGVGIIGTDNLKDLHSFLEAKTSK